VQLLAGQLLQLDDTRIQLTPRDNDGGTCPRTSFDMNRRFIALSILRPTLRHARLLNVSWWALQALKWRLS